MIVMLADKHTRNFHSLSAPSNHVARGVLAQDALSRTPLWSPMMKPYPSANGHWDPKQANRNDSGRLALSPQVLICPPLLLGHHPMVTSLLDRSKVIIWPMKDGDGKRTFELGPIVTMSCHRWDSNTKVSFLSPPYLICLQAIILTFFPLLIQQNPPHPPQQDSPVPSLPREQTPWRPTPGPKPSQTKEQPIPGPSPSSQPPEDIPACEPEPEVAPTQSTEEPFSKSALLFLHSSQLFLTFSLTISSSCRQSPLNHYHQQYARWIQPPPSHPVPPPPLQPRFPPSAPENPNAFSPLVQSPSHSHNEARQEFTNLQPTLMIP
ncbi:hypothetical protein O181_128171 [Austropuccinia psidii MF-1]|uniref:Uncharacterized protein n=1 Tax=Austropuccinia psidii MF-1 TaxID=1389203 RepID=A0A9Q3Q7F6_9BASI|nr:hypothetical protein [Austropuccinia psidii MF-1]